jgi:hypothetical protein
MQILRETDCACNLQGGGTVTAMRLLALLSVLSLGAAGALAQTTSSELTNPRPHPSAGTRQTSFAVTFTLRHDAGHSGVVQTTYQVRVGRPSGSRRACTPSAPRPVARGNAGTRVRVALIAPRVGWCRGRYRATVWLQRGPYCPPPQDGQPPSPCPLFATQEQATGTTHFTVRPPGR